MHIIPVMNRLKPILISTSRSVFQRYNTQIVQRGLSTSHPLLKDDNSKQQTKKESIFRRPSWLTLGSVVLMGGSLALYLSYLDAEKVRRREIKTAQSMKSANNIGGFSLVDQTGMRRNSEDFRGQWLLVYFGFTHCPDVCPDELEKLAQVVENIDNNERLPNIQPVFITVDPARDTKEVIKKYIEEFSPKFIGLTGTQEEVTIACKNYRVYSAAGPKDEDNDYIVDHTIIIFLIDPAGDFVEYYGRNLNADQVTEKVERNMNRQRLAERGDAGLLSNILYVIRTWMSK